MAPFAPSTPRPVARPVEPTNIPPSLSGFGNDSGIGSESESSGSMGPGGSERIKIGERPPETPWPGSSNR
jgi:hypothetical protein